MIRFASSRFGAWFSSHLLYRLDRLAFWLSDGKVSADEIASSIPAITVKTIGAKSGLPRSVPLNKITVESNYILIATNWGRHRSPAWYHNIMANPKVTVIDRGESRDFVARETNGLEKERYWRKAVEIYPGYEAYRKRLRRPVPVIVLEPGEGSEK